MRWWLRTRRPAVPAAAIALQTFALLASGTAAIDAPRLLAGPAAVVPIALLAPLTVAVALAFALEPAGRGPERTAVRDVPARDCAFAVAALAAVALAGLATGAPLAHAAARNTIGFTGVALLAGRALGARAAGLAPVAYLLVLAAVNLRPGGLAELWHWPLQAASSAPAAGVAWGLGIAGLTARAAFRVGRWR